MPGRWLCFLILLRDTFPFTSTFTLTFITTFTFSRQWIPLPGQWLYFLISLPDTSLPLPSLCRPSKNSFSDEYLAQSSYFVVRTFALGETRTFMIVFSVSLFYNRVELKSNGQVSLSSFFFSKVLKSWNLIQNVRVWSPIYVSKSKQNIKPMIHAFCSPLAPHWMFPLRCWGLVKFTTGWYPA